ncbi:MAG: hypothetical protein QOI92_296 [Chloroflexota bacterium]|nr:hypothetical protein [Chloroflexota bacterium]
MKRSVLVFIALGIVAAALVVAGCGGGSGNGSSSTGPAHEESGAPKKATAPNAPAGSKVVACKERRIETHQLRASAVDCGTARKTMRHWVSSHACTLGKGSHSSCSLDGFRCQAVRVDQGASVSCARSGADVAFIAKAWLLKKDGSG